MRSDSNFAGLLKPIPQEEFSTWLCRGVRSKNPTPFLRAADYLKQLGVANFYECFSPSSVDGMAKALGVSSKILKHSFPMIGDWLRSAPGQDLRCCEECLYDDFCCGRDSTSRAAWHYWWCNVCPVHYCLLRDYKVASPSEMLSSIIKDQISMEFRPPWESADSSRQREAEKARKRINPLVRLRFTVYRNIMLTAVSFQHWYQSSIRQGVFVINGTYLEASAAEMGVFMSDLLAIIGKKRSYPFDDRAYIAQLLDIKSWCVLNTNMHPSEGCEPFLCLEPRVYPVDIRMAMFALLGLVLKLPDCLRAWEIGSRWAPKEELKWLWPSMLWDARRSPSYLDWLKGRANNWSPHIQKHFSYLLAG